MRLDKFLSHTAGYSRSDAKRLIKSARVRVNGEVVKTTDLILGAADEVYLDEQRLSIDGPRYFMLYKPVGYVSATQDSEHPTVLDLLNEPRKHELHIAGRLDIDTTGLVLITDDGQWSHRVTSPRHESSKIYQVETAEPIPESLISLFKTGILLNGEEKQTLPAELSVLGPHQAELCIHEGRYHQVKRMFAASGNRVVKLHRSQIGSIQLDPALAEGAYRPLTAEEVASF